jgi:hypothetical protein
MHPNRQHQLNTIYRYLPRYLPIVLHEDTSGTGICKVEGNGWSYNKVINDTLNITFESSGSVTPREIFVLFALVATYQNQDYQHVATEQNSVTMTVYNVRSWAKKYLGRGDAQSFLCASLKKLVSYHVFWNFKGGFSHQQYISDAEIAPDGTMTIEFRKGFLDLCETNGLNMDWLHLTAKLSRHTTSKLLLIYLYTNSQTTLKEATLIERLGLTSNPRKCREILKKAFQQLVNKFIASYEYNNKNRTFSYVPM